MHYRGKQTAFVVDILGRMWQLMELSVWRLFEALGTYGVLCDLNNLQDGTEMGREHFFPSSQRTAKKSSNLRAGHLAGIIESLSWLFLVGSCREYVVRDCQVYQGKQQGG